MIPIDDNLPNRYPPLVTYGLIGLNVALFVMELRLEAKGQLGAFLQSWGVISDRMTSVVTDAIRNPSPAAWVALIVMSAGPLLFSMFLHSSFSQILGNMLFLWVFGKRIEEILGHGRFLLFYLVCGILTAIAQVAIAPNLAVPVIGANGAVSAILGAYLLNFPKAKIETLLPLVILFIPIEVPALFYLMWWFIQQAFYGIGQLTVLRMINPTSLGYWANGAGLFIGAGLVSLLVKYKPKTAIY